jgi:hypothetical protein
VAEHISALTTIIADLGQTVGMLAVAAAHKARNRPPSRSATTMPDNKDIAVLAKKVYELSVLPAEALDARKWEALLILNAVYSSATPEGIDKANADKAARWGAQIEQEGLLSRMHPKWHLRTDDGKPPAARHALESALSNPTRDLRARLATLQFIAPADRPPLDDLARALISDAFNGARARPASSTSTSRAPAARTGFASPGRSCSRKTAGCRPSCCSSTTRARPTTAASTTTPPPTTGMGPLSWANAVRTWNVDFLRDNPLASSTRRSRPPPARSSRPPARSPRAPTRPRRASPRPCSNGPRMSSRASVGQRLTDLLVLAQGAVEGDGQRTLPILDLALERLAHEYSQRLGLFSLEDRGVAPRADATIIALAGNAP